MRGPNRCCAACRDTPNRNPICSHVHSPIILERERCTLLLMPCSHRPLTRVTPPWRRVSPGAEEDFLGRDPLASWPGSCWLGSGITDNGGV